MRVDEALAWYRSENYVQPDADNGVSFEVADNADVIVNAVSEPDARTVMGDADLVRASGGTVTVDGSDALQGLSFFVAEKDGQVISSYAIEDTAAGLMSTSTSEALASLNVAGVSSITLVDASVSDLANAADGASLNAIADGLTNGAIMSFLVEDSATNLAANASNLNLADDVSVGTDGDNEVTVFEATALNGITNYDNLGGYTISDDATAVAGSSVEILGDSDSVTVTGVADATQGATINGFESSVANITFNVEDSATNLAANALSLNLADGVSVGTDGDNEVTVFEATALNGITNYDNLGGYTISDDATAVAGSSVDILGDSDSVTVTGVANATQGAKINGFDAGTSDTPITFSVKDTGDGLNNVLGADEDLSRAVKVELTSDDGSLVLDVTSNISDVSATKAAMADFASLTSAGRTLALENIVDNSTSLFLPEYSSAMVAIEDLNAVISGDSADSVAGAIAAVRATVKDIPNQTIDGGAGFGLVDASADGEVASPVNLGMAQRMDDLFEAMSDAQVAAVQAQIVGSGASDIVGALSAMGVFDMGGPTEQTDPTTSNFMTTFDALDDAAQVLVLENADPLDLASMTAVTNAVDAIEDLNAVISGDSTDSIADAIAAVRATMALGSNSKVADDTIDGGAGFGLVDASADGEVASPVNLGMAQRMDDLFEAMSDAQVAAVQAQIVGSGASDIVGALSAMGVFDMGGPTEQTDPTTSNFMTTFDALDDAAQVLVLANADPLDVDSMTAVTNAVDAIEALNDVISGDSTDSIADAIAAVRATMEADVLGSNSKVADDTIDGGAGFGLVDASADGEVASPVNLGMAQRMDDLFEAMSDAQVAAVQAQIVGSGASDIVGALSAMGVFDMGGPTEQTDPTTSNFMTTFDALDDAAQVLVLENADPLDLASMTAVTNAVDAIEDLNAVISGDSTDSIADAIAAVRATMEADVLGSNSEVADDTIDGGAGFGLVDASADGEVASPVNLGMAQRMDDLFEAMSDAQVATVQAQIVGSGASDIVGALSAMGVFDMGGPTEQTDPTTSNFMTTFDALDDAAQVLVLENADPLDLASMTAVTNAVDAIEDLNAVISGDSTDSIADAIAAVHATMALGSNAKVADDTIDGGAGFGLVDASADGEVASPVNLGMAQRMDDLFEAMSDAQVAAVQAQIVGSGASDIVGALSAMGVFDMGGPTEQTDPTTSNFMTTFDALDDAAQVLVLENADPLDLASMTAVTNAVDAIEDLNAVISGDSTDSIADAIAAVHATMALGSNSKVADDTIDGWCWLWPC